MRDIATSSPAGRLPKANSRRTRIIWIRVRIACRIHSIWRGSQVVQDTGLLNRRGVHAPPRVRISPSPPQGTQNEPSGFASSFAFRARVARSAKEPQRHLPQSRRERRGLHPLPSNEWIFREYLYDRFADRSNRPARCFAKRKRMLRIRRSFPPGNIRLVTCQLEANAKRDVRAKLKLVRT